MKKIIIATTLLAGSLFADTVTFSPYAGVIDYDKSVLKTAKDSAKLYGAHASVGTLSYLLEFDYAKIKTDYKNPTLTKLDQDDITLAYARYFDKLVVRGGFHNISTNDAQLGDGYTVFGALGGYAISFKNRVDYGVELFYTKFDKGHDENYVAKSIAITQISPYFSYYNSISTDWGNTVALRLNYQIAKDYVQDNYFSYEISDTLFYKNAFLTVKGYGGEMRTGVKDRGFTVFNTLDLYKSGYGAKLGYTLGTSTTLSISYDVNNFQEYGFVAEGSNTVTFATLSYTF